MNRRMSRPEDVSRHHIDATVMGFLKREKDADWTEVALVTLHPREEIRIVLEENVARYRGMNATRFYELLVRLKDQGASAAKSRKRKPSISSDVPAIARRPTRPRHRGAC